MGQKLYSPIDYGFRWVGDWYEFDTKAATAAARKARDARFNELKRLGQSPRKFSLGMQRITRGGIGSGHPEVDFVLPCYGLNYDDAPARIETARLVYSAMGF
jgi:hypothetical protein